MSTSPNINMIPFFRRRVNQKQRENNNKCVGEWKSIQTIVIMKLLQFEPDEILINVVARPNIVLYCNRFLMFFHDTTVHTVRSRSLGCGFIFLLVRRHYKFIYYNKLSDNNRTDAHLRHRIEWPLNVFLVMKIIIINQSKIYALVARELREHIRFCRIESDCRTQSIMHISFE